MTEKRPVGPAVQEVLSSGIAWGTNPTLLLFQLGGTTRLVSRLLTQKNKEASSFLAVYYFRVMNLPFS